MLLILLSSVFLVKSSMKFQLFPQDGVERFYLKLEMQHGASLAATEARLKELENHIETLPESELESYSTRVGTLSTSLSQNRGDHSHWGLISVFLTGEANRSRSADEIIESLRNSVPTNRRGIVNSFSLPAKYSLNCEIVCLIISVSSSIYSAFKPF